ncbi:MAG: hypothetical protein ACLSG4_11835 [Anaerobutyricum sp.]|jgi:hypothetical protein|uniref:hypothetical protein n=1 Tax=Blautia sp. BIOML-A1 TaxID=2584624 RepID=UPI0013683669|nr:hypothetical protein [Blautia sp. BIOML-A1]MZT66326.1 hypothetical protein [Blautia sp. BIOML-A1]
MPNLQVVNQVKHDFVAYNNLLYYVARPDRCRNRMIGMTNVFFDFSEAPKNLVNKQVQRFREYHSVNSRYAIHIIVCFSPDEVEYLSCNRVLEIGYFLAETEFKDCICFFAVHDHSTYEGTNKVYLHLDFMLIPFSIYDGRGYDCGKAGWYKIANDIKEYLKKFMPSSVISTHIIFPGRREKNDLFNEI